MIYVQKIFLKHFCQRKTLVITDDMMDNINGINISAQI